MQSTARGWDANEKPLALPERLATAPGLMLDDETFRSGEGGDRVGDCRCEPPSSSSESSLKLPAGDAGDGGTLERAGEEAGVRLPAREAPLGERSMVRSNTASSTGDTFAAASQGVASGAAGRGGVAGLVQRFGFEFESRVGLARPGSAGGRKRGVEEVQAAPNSAHSRDSGVSENEWTSASRSSGSLTSAVWGEPSAVQTTSWLQYSSPSPPRPADTENGDLEPRESVTLHASSLPTSAGSGE
jgi:hypothetical protein